MTSPEPPGILITVGRSPGDCVALHLGSEVWGLAKDPKLPTASSFYNSRFADTGKTDIH